MRQLAMAVALALGAGCGGDERPGDDDSPAVDGEAIEKVTDAGPVKATVSVAPAEPALGDPITLTLEVEAEAGVVVEMPSFGEALGRFTIVDFTPRDRSAASGGTVSSQTYTLQAPMSGRQRIPPLRIEFVDQRSGQSGAEVRELLTDEIPLQVESVLPDGAVAAELRPARDRLEPASGASPLRRAGLGLLAAVVLGGAAFGVRWWRRRALARARVNAFDVAMRRLAELERRGLPSAEEADAWYVELSGIVRRYLEDRYRVRAPELTTEEFLQEAQRSAELTDSHRQLLGSFLQLCDRVKFAGHQPDDAESLEAIAAARRFLQDSRPRQVSEAAA